MMAQEGCIKLIYLIFLHLSLHSFALETVRVQSGSLELFWLGPKTEDRKKKNERLIIKSLEVMTAQVTKAEFLDFLIKNPKWNKNIVSSVFADVTYIKNFDYKRDNRPITEVSWFVAKSFCESHNMRLPTLVEWEYLAAASEIKSNANKDEKFLRRILDWYGETKSEKLKNVKSIYKNKYQIWDLHGLVWEWVEDFNSSFVTGESREDSSFNKNMFCGAGSMSGANKEDYAAFMRFAFRSSLKGNSTVWNLGFRCVRSL